VEHYGAYSLIGQTTDDAAGEAFDKVARVLQIPYPGGPLLDKLADEGDDHAYKFPHPHTPGKYDFSFSGLKTAVINQAHNLRQQGEEIRGYTEAGLIDYKAYTPAFTLEESEEIAEIEMELQVIFESSIDAFIKGERSMEEWPDLVEELKDAGSERLEELFNEAYNR